MGLPHDDPHSQVKNKYIFLTFAIDFSLNTFISFLTENTYKFRSKIFGCEFHFCFRILLEYNNCNTIVSLTKLKHIPTVKVTFSFVFYSLFIKISTKYIVLISI